MTARVLISPAHCLWTWLIFFLFLFDRILIRERAHFGDILSSDDFSYGEEDCKDLACDEPELVLKNAGSYVSFRLVVSVKMPSHFGSLLRTRVIKSDVVDFVHRRIQLCKWLLHPTKH